ncbi:MATE family efflux transporter [Xenorhabdus budapestensis]|uniref:MATE family efflux transporter n=1 Tax=Xenorhabdus budapestensis TaxID=290110 RepID=A0ABX7VJ30_XENBU|nr:MATE family efflux transporter [Xenorhabdus budapestensis]QTL39797.1 MATE family efflux transporter [Xenorhabdus budapestensis]
MLKIPNHLIVASSSWLSKIIIAGVQILSISYLMPLLGEDEYAVFSLLTGLLVWCSIVDLGVGNSLQNYISESRAKNENYDSYIKSSLHIIAVSFILFFFFFYLFSNILASFYLSSFDHLINGESGNLFFTASIIFSTISIGTVAYKILFAELIGWKANLYNAMSYLIGFLGITVVHKYNINTDINNSLIILYAPVGLISLSYISYRYLKLINVRTTWQSHLLILKRSIGFLIFSFLSILVLQADYIVISQKLSASDIVIYTVTMKIFGLVFFIYSAVLQALWPICAELRIKHQWAKLNKMIFVNIIFGMTFICISTLFIYFFKEKIISIISKEINYNLDASVYAIIALYFCIRVWCDTYAMLLQSMNSLKILWFFVPCQAVISGTAQWYLSEYLGVSGILLGLTLSFILTVCWGLPIAYINKVKKVVLI